MVGLVAGLLLIASCGDDDRAAEIDAGQGEIPSESTAVATEGLGDPLGGAWSEDGVFVYRATTGNGSGDRSDSAELIDPSTGSSTPVTDPPFEAALSYRPAIAALGDHVLVIGNMCRQFSDGDSERCDPSTASAASYSLQERMWTTVDLPDELARGTDFSATTLGWTEDGRALFEMRAEAVRVAGEAPFWTYTPESGEWDRLDDPGVAVDDACLAGNRLVVASSVETANGRGDVTLHTFDLADQSDWTTGAPLPEVELSSKPGLGCGDDLAVIFAPQFSQTDTNARAVMSQSLDAIERSEWTPFSGFSDELGFVLDPVWTGNRLLLADLQNGVGALLDNGSHTVEMIDVPVSDAAGEIPPLWADGRLAVLSSSREAPVEVVGVAD